MKVKVCGLVALMAFLSVTHAGATTFGLENLQIGPDSVTGTITTDGATGALLQTDISSWALTINAGNGPVALNGPGNPATSAANYSGLALTVVGTGLFFNYSLATDSFLEIGALSGPNINIILADAAHFTGTLFQFSDGQGGNPTTSSVSGNVLIGSAISATPLPATLPLFAGGLGFVGYLMRRKKRNAQALAA